MEDLAFIDPAVACLREPDVEGNIAMKEFQPPPQRTVFPSKTRVREEWAKLDFEPENPPDNEDQTALQEVFQDDLFGLGNE